MRRLIVDLDDTISITIEGDYVNSLPIQPFIDTLHRYKSDGFEIIINSSRNMRTHNSNVGKINIFTLPNIIRWLEDNNVPFDEVYIGKPWCGFDGFYIDDKCIRPSEFLANNYDEIVKILKQEKEYIKSLI
jgi:capsule biosynthesis phosphatase